MDTSLLKPIRWAKISLLVLLLPLSINAKESTSVLPKGVFRGRVVGVFAPSISDKYDSSSELQNLTGSLNKEVSLADIAKKEPALQNLVNTLNGISPGAGNQLIGASLLSEAEINNSTYVTALEYGLTKNISIGIQIPVVQQNVDANFNSQSNDNTPQALRSYGQMSSELAAGILTARAAIQITEQQIFLDKGYEVPHGFSKTDLGDIEVGFKHRFFNRNGLILAVQPGIRIPSGTTPSLSNILDKGTGTGAFAVGGRMIEEYFPNEKISFGAVQKLVYNFEDKRDMAVPSDADDALPDLNTNVRNVTRQQAMDFELELTSTLWFMEKTYSVWGGYQYFTKGTDSFAGPDDLYYSGLSENTDKEIHTAEIGFSYSSIPAFKRKEVSIPFEVKTTYRDTLNGRNTPLVSYVRMDALFYF